MYVENAQGGLYGKIIEALGVADSILPMNVKVSLWGKLARNEDLKDSRVNIQVGVLLIKQIKERAKNATIEKVASIYHFLGRENVSDYGARVGVVLRDGSWNQKR